MQFKIAALVAAMASAAAAQSTVTVYACETSTSSGVASPTIPPVASTGVVPPTPTGSPIFTGAASVNGPALGLMVAGGLALFL